jgi:osmoprotectant transport system permease protein
MTAANAGAPTRRRAVIAVLGVVLVVAFVAWARHRVAGLSEDTQAVNPIVRWEYLFKRHRTTEELWRRGKQHLELTVVPVVLGFVISSVLAAIVRRFRWLLGPVFALAGFLYTIPSLALFGVLVTYNSNWTAAVIALTTYTLLIITRNIVDGLDGVPAAALDAADGLGMSRWQRLRQVEIPLALPVILTGVRVATVTTVGLVGVSAVIQLGGLAYLIFDGYDRSFTTEVVVGTALMILLAIALDLVLRGVERASTPWARVRSAR